eukprot:scaffold268340_cov37-Tisochrysis_lutea.AAC.2
MGSARVGSNPALDEDKDKLSLFVDHIEQSRMRQVGGEHEHARLSCTVTPTVPIKPTAPSDTFPSLVYPSPRLSLASRSSVNKSASTSTSLRPWHPRNQGTTNQHHSVSGLDDADLPSRASITITRRPCQAQACAAPTMRYNV